MSLDEQKLVASVESTMESIPSGEGVHTHNLRFEFGTFDNMMRAGRCLQKYYDNRFKIFTEIQPPTDVDPLENGELFYEKTKYFILMNSRNLGGPFS